MLNRLRNLAAPYQRGILYAAIAVTSVMIGLEVFGLVAPHVRLVLETF